MSIRIGVTSQNLRTVTGHAGKTRRFLVYERGDNGICQPIAPIELPMDQAFHHWQEGTEHPLFQLDYLLTAKAGDGFVRKMAAHGVRVIITDITEPQEALKLVDH